MEAIEVIFFILAIYWIFKPQKKNPEFIDYLPEKLEISGNEKNEPISIKIIEPKLNINSLNKIEEIKRFEFRPHTWNEFIGQEKAKKRAQTIIKRIKKGMKGHFLVDGIKGHGKTTYVLLLAKYLKAKVIHRIGKQIDEDEIINILNEINSSTEKYVMLFIDEIDTMKWQVLKIFNPIIEDFQLAGNQIRPFIFAGATINKYKLIEKTPDTLDRIPVHLKFVRYSAIEIKTILKQYNVKMYPQEILPENVIDIFSKNCKYNPRTGIYGLLEDYIVEKNVERVLENSQIVKNGLTKLDIRVLNALKEAGKPMGANALAMRVGIQEKEYTNECEPFLVEYGYIKRTPRRELTQRGLEIINAKT